MNCYQHVKRRAAAGSPAPWRTCQKADAIADRMPGMGDHRPAVGCSRMIGRHCGRSAHLMSALTWPWTVIFLVSYIEADWSGRIWTAGPTQWRNYGYQLTEAETSVPSAPYRLDTPLSFVSQRRRLVCGPRPPLSNKRSADSKRWATGDNYLAHSRPIVKWSCQSRFSKSRNSFPGIKKKMETRDSRVSLTSLVSIIKAVYYSEL